MADKELAPAMELKKPTQVNPQAMDSSGGSTSGSSHDHVTAYSEKVKFNRSINLVTAIGMIIGQIIGAGIFVSPKGVLLNTGSKGKQLCKKC